MPPASKALIAAGIGAVAAAGVGAAFLVLRPAPSSPTGVTPTPCANGPPSDVAPLPDGSCPSGYQPDPVYPGCCMPTCPGSTACQSNSDCSAGEVCVGGCCGVQTPPFQIVNVNNPQDNSQDVTAFYLGIGVVGECYDYKFEPDPSYPNVFTFSGTLIDGNGNPVPNYPLGFSFEGGTSVYSDFGSVVTTDSDGNFTFYYRLSSPSSQSPCCIQCSTQVSDTLDVLYQNGTLITKFVTKTIIYVTGVGP